MIFRLYEKSGNGMVITLANSGYTNAQTSSYTTYNEDERNHIVATLDGSDLRFYHN